MDCAIFHTLFHTPRRDMKAPSSRSGLFRQGVKMLSAAPPARPCLPQAFEPVPRLAQEALRIVRPAPHLGHFSLGRRHCVVNSG